MYLGFVYLYICVSCICAFLYLHICVSASCSCPPNGAHVGHPVLDHQKSASTIFYRQQTIATLQQSLRDHVKPSLVIFKMAKFGVILYKDFGAYHPYHDPKCP